MIETSGFKPIPSRNMRVWSLPNVLTYGRIIAVPALVLCFYIEGYVGRWLALAIFIAASVTDYLDGYLARVWQQTSASAGCSIRSPTSCSSRRRSSCWSRSGPSAALAARRDRHPDPRDRRLRPSRVSRRAAGQRAGHAARQVEDDAADGGDRLPHRRAGRRPAAQILLRRSRPRDLCRPPAPLDLGADHALHRLRLFPRRPPAPDGGGQ